MKDLIIKDLAEVINKWGYDSKTDTPDFILAESVYDYLKDFIKTQNKIKNEEAIIYLG